MSRSHDDQGRLAYIECDHCNAKIRPNPDIEESGWMKNGIIELGGMKLQWDSCPACAAKQRAR